MILFPNENAPNTARGDAYLDPPHITAGGLLPEGAKTVLVSRRQLKGPTGRRFRRTITNSNKAGAWHSVAVKDIQDGGYTTRGKCRTFMYEVGHISRPSGRVTTTWKMTEYSMFPELDHTVNLQYLALYVIELVGGRLDPHPPILGDVRNRANQLILGRMNAPGGIQPQPGNDDGM